MNPSSFGPHSATEQRRSPGTKSTELISSNLNDGFLEAVIEEAESTCSHPPIVLRLSIIESNAALTIDLSCRARHVSHWRLTGL